MTEVRSPRRQAGWQGLATPLFTGPIARAAGGIDLSLPAGHLMSAAVYLLMMTRSRRPGRQQR